MDFTRRRLVGSLAAASLAGCASRAATVVTESQLSVSNGGVEPRDVTLRVRRDGERVFRESFTIYPADDRRFEDVFPGAGRYELDVEFGSDQTRTGGLRVDPAATPKSYARLRVDEPDRVELFSFTVRTPTPSP